MVEPVGSLFTETWAELGVEVTASIKDSVSCFIPSSVTALPSDPSTKIPARHGKTQ